MKRRSRRKNVDRLSSLPEEVLSQILSLLPTRYAVRTSTLSKSWRYNWMLVTNLDFEDDNPVHDLDCLLNFVDRVLNLHKTPQVKLFRLCFSRYLVPKSTVSKWINEAVRLNFCELDIQVRQFELPLSLFTYKTITKLRLDADNGLDVLNVVPSSVMLPSLKTLDLRVDGKACVNVLRFIHGCPVLESLSLEIMSVDNEPYINFNIPTLLRLELKTTSCLSSSKVVLNVPNLEYLFVGGESLRRPRFVMEDLSSLVEAIVSFSGLRIDDRETELIKGLSGVTSLSWSFSTLNDFVHSPMPKFPKLKHLDLTGSSRSPWFLVVQILESSSELEHLCFEEPEDSCWIEPQSIPTCMLPNLKTMKITKCKGRKCDIQFLEYMLGNADVLKTLIITCQNLRMKEEMEICARLLKFSRASRFCEIHFLGTWLNSTRD